MRVRFSHVFTSRLKQSDLFRHVSSFQIHSVVSSFQNYPVATVHLPLNRPHPPMTHSSASCLFCSFVFLFVPVISFTCRFIGASHAGKPWMAETDVRPPTQANKAATF